MWINYMSKWMTQKLMAELFDTGIDNINEFYISDKNADENGIIDILDYFLS